MSEEAMVIEPGVGQHRERAEHDRRVPNMVLRVECVAEVVRADQAVLDIRVEMLVPAEVRSQLPPYPIGGKVH